MLVMACALEGEAATLQPGSGDDITTDSQAPAHYGGFGSSQGRSINESPAIWVTGEGKVTIDPELAVLDLSVEVTMETVGKRPRRSGACDGRGHDGAEVQRGRGERHPDAEL